ncbi:MAG: Veg family protein [Bacilli bacterium]|nr:Veg family protein [Bacilli bacterium]
MNIEEIRKDITNHIGKTIKIKYNLGRNKYETYDVVVVETYKNLFTVKVNSIIKSFTYNDVITKIIKINY